MIGVALLFIYTEVGVNMVGVRKHVWSKHGFHDAICERFEGAMLEPCSLKPCMYVYIYIYMYIYIDNTYLCVHIYIYI